MDITPKLLHILLMCGDTGERKMTASINRRHHQFTFSKSALHKVKLLLQARESHWMIIHFWGVDVSMFLFQITAQKSFTITSSVSDAHSNE